MPAVLLLCGKQMKRKTVPKPDYYSQREWNRIVARERAEQRRIARLMMILVLLLAVTACMFYAVYYFVLRSHDKGLPVAFDSSNAVYGVLENTGKMVTAPPFADGLCVTGSDVNADSIFITATEGALFDLQAEEVRYAKNIFETRSPASLTKVMTALVALKYANPDDRVTVTQAAFDIEMGSSVCELHLGDRLTLKQLLYGLLIASGNDAAMQIAEYVGGGSISNFVNMMNEEAAAIGATHTHFVNAHGLTAENHYTCAYDMYLIFREAMKYDMFMDIINRENYYAEYTDADGDAYAMTWESTDHYLTGEASLPSNVIIYGGKTGTTTDAGACLVLLTKDLYGNPYISVIMHSETKESLYVEMNQILSLI